MKKIFKRLTILVLLIIFSLGITTSAFAAVVTLEEGDEYVFYPKNGAKIMFRRSTSELTGFYIINFLLYYRSEKEAANEWWANLRVGFDDSTTTNNNAPLKVLFIYEEKDISPYFYGRWGSVYTSFDIYKNDEFVGTHYFNFGIGGRYYTQKYIETSIFTINDYKFGDVVKVVPTRIEREYDMPNFYEDVNKILNKSFTYQTYDYTGTSIKLDEVYGSYVTMTIKQNRNFAEIPWFSDNQVIISEVSTGERTVHNANNLVTETWYDSDFRYRKITIPGLKANTLYRFMYNNGDPVSPGSYPYIRFYSGNCYFITADEVRFRTGVESTELAAQEAKKARQILDGTDNPNVKLANTFYNGKSSAQWAYESINSISKLENKFDTKIEELENKINNIDNQSPTISELYFYKDKSITRNTVETLYFNVNDNVTPKNKLLVRYAVNNSNFSDWQINYGSLIHVNLSSGYNKILVEVKDEKGNTSSKSIGIWKI